jgi:Flavoprotein
MRLLGKKILIGVTGSIAAYKVAEIIRLFIKEGAEIQVVMTRSAHDFVTPLTLATLSKRPVLTDFSDPFSGTWNNHVELGLWADAYLIPGHVKTSFQPYTFLPVARCSWHLPWIWICSNIPWCRKIWINW